MQVRVLGCSGAIARDCRTTSFLIDGRILIDAGTGVGDLTLDEMQAVDDVFLTHSHLDHIAALPMMLDAVASRRAEPLRLHALPDTIAALQQHIFNDVIWPDFSRIPSQTRPFVRYQPLQMGQCLQVAGVDIEVLPARHTVPAVGYAARGETGWWVFSGDTGGHCPEFWQRVNQLPLAALVIETAFSNREGTLARLAQHLAPTPWPRNWRNWRQASAAPSTLPTPSPQRRISSCRRSASLTPAPPRVLRRRMTFGGCKRGMCCRFDMLG